MKREPTLESGLTFPWTKSPLSLWRLLPAFVLCATVLAILSFLVKPAAPPPARASSLSHSILLLDPSLPANQTVLNRARDRDALILRSDSVDTSLLGEPLLPVFRPSFTGFQLRLKTPYVKRASAAQPRLFQPLDLALPAVAPASSLPMSATAATARAGTGPWQLQAVFESPLASRLLQTKPALESLRPQDLAKLRFQMAVKPDGRAFLVLPLTSSVEDRELVPRFIDALSGTRFEANPGSAIEWGRVTFTWTTVSGSQP